MTLPGSGTLDYNSIRAEFGSPSSNVYLNLYYRGGPYTYNVPANAPITTGSSSQLSVSNFYGTRGKSDYAAGPGGTHATGGKLPSTYYGTGGPSLPAMTDTSFKVGGSSRTLTGFYWQDTSIFDSMVAVCSPGSWAATVNVYTNNNGSNAVNVPISNATYNGYPGGWSGTSYLETFGPAYTALNTGQLNIYRGS
jgi:hypothetical protein